MGQQFVRLLAGVLEAQRVVDVLVNLKLHSGIGAINAGTSGIDEMLDIIMATTFKYIGKAD